MRKFITHTILSSSLAFLAMQSHAQEPSVDEIVKKANHVAFYQGDDGRAENRMKFVDASGRTQMRQFTILRKDVGKEDGDQLFYVLFERPTDVNGTAFLVKKHIGKDDDRWLYLPSLDLVKRISAGDKRTSFVGSDFFYEDVSGRALSEDKHTLVETTATHYVIDNIPNDPSSVEFKHFKVWINKETFLPEKTEYYKQGEKLYRTIEALKHEVIDGYVTVTEMKVSNLETGGYTISQMRFIKYDTGTPESVFSERSLRTPPQQWISRPQP